MSLNEGTEQLQCPQRIFTGVSDSSASTVAGRVLYDAFGGVLTRTAPISNGSPLTGTLPPGMIDLLAGQASIDPDAGLVYLGNGRYFDPLLGLPLQPNPLGGVPTVPQSLNRYAAGSLGQPGVAEGVMNGGGCLANALCGEVLNKVTGLGADKATDLTMSAVGLAGWGKSYTKLDYQGLGRYYIQVAYPGQSGVRLLGNDFQKYGSRSYIDSTGRIVDLGELEDIFKDFSPAGQHQGTIVVEEFVESVERKINPPFSAKLGRGILNNTFPFGVDAAFQLYQDWNNPRLTLYRKGGRAVVAGGVGLAGGAIVGSIIAPEATIPFLIAGVIFGITIETPVTTWVNNNVPFLKEMPQDLHPLK